MTGNNFSRYNDNDNDDTDDDYDDDDDDDERFKGKRWVVNFVFLWENGILEVKFDNNFDFDIHILTEGNQPVKYLFI